MEINSYIKVYEKRLNDKYCSTILKELETHAWGKHMFHNAYDQTTYSSPNDIEVSFTSLSNHNHLMSLLWDTIREYVDGLSSPWFGTWNGYSIPRYNRYVVGSEMLKHCDHIHSLFEGGNKGVPILSIVGLLNDDFKGGDFMMNDEKIDLVAGDILMFPSSFLYPHEVLKITEGTRFSFVSWVW